MFRKFLRLFFTGKSFVPPTKNQIEYAKLCGVTIRTDMDRESVTQAIDAAFAADPKLRFKVSARRKKIEKQTAESVDSLPIAQKREFKKMGKRIGPA